MVWPGGQTKRGKRRISQPLLGKKSYECEIRRRDEEGDEDFDSEDGLIISLFVVELFSKIRFEAVVVAGFDP